MKGAGPLLWVGAALALVALGLGGIKMAQGRAMGEAKKNFRPPPETVGTAQVVESEWEESLTAVGTVSAARGTMVSAEVPGVVQRIAFESGSEVREGAVLVELDADVEKANLRAVEATAEWKGMSLKRSEELRQRGVVSMSEMDLAQAEARNTRALADNIRAAIEKKVVRAPFDGRAGIRLVNLGQFVKEGDPIVTFQSLDPLHVDFTLPQRRLSVLREGLELVVVTDAFAGREFKGRLTAINPEVDASTRNVKLQGTVPNKKGELRPGLFVDVRLVLEAREKVLVIPATAVVSAPYGDKVFVVKPAEGGQGQVVVETPVRVGRARGDFVAVQSGLASGDTVVSAGAFKLRNGAPVTVKNGAAPAASLEPNPGDS